MKNKALFKSLDENKNTKITDYAVGMLVHFKDGEVWKVVEPSKISTGLFNRKRSDEISIKPYNDLAKKKNVSLAIEVDLNYLNDNVTKIVKESVDESDVNESRAQIKRKYGEYGAIRVNSEAPIRNSILEFIGKRFVTEEEMKAHLTKLSEDRGTAIDQTKWFSRNMRYFESFENRGAKVWTLSKYGKRVLENIIKSKQEKTMIKESIGLFKFNEVNEASVPNFSMLDYSKLSPREQQLHGDLSQVIFKYKNLKKEEKLNAVGGLLKRIESGDLSESIDVKYWEDYNTDTSGQGKKEHEVKSKDFEDTFEDAVVYWNQEADGAENRIKGAQIQKIKKLAQEFFKKAGWISSNVIQAMIAQES